MLDKPAPRWSPAAVAIFTVAVLGSLFVWNPFMAYTGILTVALAAVVLRGVRHAAPPVAGRGLAVAAMVLGVAEIAFVFARSFLVL